MSIKEYLSSNPTFLSEAGLFLQKSLPRENAFEESYLSLRKKEGRLYDDDVVRHLPLIDSSHPLLREWKIRKLSADRLIKHLKTKSIKSIVEIGCGNGWLTNYVAKQTGYDCFGVDINLTELRQATRVFQSNNINFVYADVLSDALEDLKTDIILLPSCLQYFSDAQGLLRLLLQRLRPDGEIHLLDTPIYDAHTVRSARERSLNYFDQQGGNSMNDYYHHHNWEVFKGLSYEILYDPSSLWNRVQAKLILKSPFIWMKIKAPTAAIR